MTDRRPLSARSSRWLPLVVLAIAFALAPSVSLRAAAPDPADAQRELLAGNYAYVIEHGTVAIRDPAASNEWLPLLARAQLAVGRNAAAGTTIADALSREPTSIKLRWLAREISFANGRPDEAAAYVEEIRRYVMTRQWLYRNPIDLVTFGRAALLLNYDPKEVLDKLFATAQKAEPKLRDVYLARGELALDKHDFALAARAYEDGLKQLPGDPDLHYGRARAYVDSQRETAMKSLDEALKINPRHVPSLLLLADNRIDGEEYAEAAKLLDQVIAINPVQPDAWAYRAVLAHLRYDIDAEATARATALRSWATNPRVDFLIGQKLSQKYRFAEGAAYQRRAITFDASYLPANAQLASDLLRLGNEDEGWRIAQAVHDHDEYDVEAFNLVTLRDTMAKYATLTSDDITVRMASSEVTIYGPRVLALLRKAKATLATKYGVELAKPTYVEIFADQKDFAVRTFGLPDVPGFLGVCFGRVVTANGPGANGGHPVNWESVLWHEFCHAVTLQLTRNRMPRWLSEGISVYEERQADPSWGMRLNARYRAMIAKDGLTPVGSLSAAFLAPKTSEHLQFAYLESSMVVEFIISRYGIDHLRGVLTDLRNGQEINAALEKNVSPLAQLEKDFTAFVRERSDRLALGLDMEKPGPTLLDPDAASDLVEWQKKHPDNYWALTMRARQLAEDKNWAEARKVLARLAELNPSEKGSETPYRPLVTVLRELGDVPAEREALTKWAAIDDEATEAYLRLMELGTEAKDWPVVARNAERFLRVNPLVAPPWRYLAQASAATGDTANGIAALRTLLQLDPPDPAAAHFQLAQLLQKTGATEESRRQTLLALEEAPRYREALKLLLELKAADSSTAAPVKLPVEVPKL
jgi:tetratricopeptide (TPR) repeat protein